MNNKRILAIVFVIAMFIVGCSNVPDEKPIDNDNRLKVYTTVYPVYDFAKKIGKDKINVNLMVAPGAEPHDWEPSAKLLAEIESADVLIYNGAGLETWIDRVIGSIDTSNLVVVEATKGLELLKYDDEHDEDEGFEEDEHGVFDPHVWLDPIRTIGMAENIKDAFITADEENKEFYQDNFEECRIDLEKLDSLYKEGLQSTSLDKIVVSHASFGYLADRYDLEQISIAGITPQNEPSSAKLAEISNIVRQHNIKYIFFETLTSPKVAEVLARETNTKTDVLNPLGGLTEKEINEGKEYIGVMKENLNVLKNALR